MESVIVIAIISAVMALVVVYQSKEKKKLIAQLDKVTSFNRDQDHKIHLLESVVKKNKEDSEELQYIQRNTILNQKSELDQLHAEHKKLHDKTNKVESQKKSSEVKLGLMAENFMPFIRDYPYDHKRFRFLANPVDGIQVTDDAVIFIEFKTGGARLSKSQRAIRDLVAKGHVRFETFRVDAKGTSLKIESEMLDGFTLDNVEPKVRV